MRTGAPPSRSAPTTPTVSSPRSKPEKRAAPDVVRLIAAATVLRIVLAAAIGLGVDESYAVAVGRGGPPSLSYFDHPPLVFWLAAATGRLGDSAVVLRLPFIALFAGTSWLVYRLTALLFGERAGWYAAVTLSLVPVLSVSAGGWILPDGPLLFGEALAALALAQLSFGQVRDESAWWLAAGLGTGIALLSKYHALLFLAGVLLWAATTGREKWGVWLRRPAPYLAALVAGLGALPVVVWNATHDWASVRFQLSRASGQHGAPLVALLQNLGGQIGYVLPWIWIPMIWALYRAVRGRGGEPRNDRRWFLACLAIVPIALFTGASLGGSPGLPHWPAPGYLFLVPLVGEWLADVESRRGARGVRRGLVLAAAGVTFPVALIASQASMGWLNGIAPELFRRADPSLDLLDWTPLRPQLEARGLLDGGRPVFAVHWIDAAKLAYALGPLTPVRCLGDDPRHFRFLSPLPAREDSLILVRSGTGGLPLAELRRTAPHLGSIAPAGVFTIERRGQPAIFVAAFLAGHIDQR